MKRALRRISLLFLLSYPSHQITLPLPAEWKRVRNFWRLGRLGWLSAYLVVEKLVLDADYDCIYDIIGYSVKLRVFWTTSQL